MCTIYNNQTSDNTQAGSSGYFSRVYLMQGVTRSPAEDFYGVCFDLLFNIRFYSFIAPPATPDRCIVHDLAVLCFDYIPHGNCVYILLFTLCYSAMTGFICTV